MPVLNRPRSVTSVESVKRLAGMTSAMCTLETGLTRSTAFPSFILHLPSAIFARVQFRKITIIGVGLLGGSIGLAVKRRKLAAAKSPVSSAARRA